MLLSYLTVGRGEITMPKIELDLARKENENDSAYQMRVAHAFDANPKGPYIVKISDVKTVETLLIIREIINKKNKTNKEANPKNPFLVISDFQLQCKNQEAGKRSIRELHLAGKRPLEIGEEMNPLAKILDKVVQIDFTDHTSSWKRGEHKSGTLDAAIHSEMQTLEQAQKRSQKPNVSKHNSNANKR